MAKKDSLLKGGSILGIIPIQPIDPINTLRAELQYIIGNDNLRPFEKFAAAMPVKRELGRLAIVGPARVRFDKKRLEDEMMRATRVRQTREELEPFQKVNGGVK